MNLCTKVGHNFGSHMTPPEFYVSSDAIVHLQISTEYFNKSCRTELTQLAGCLAQQAKVSSRGQSTIDRQHQCEGLNVL